MTSSPARITLISMRRSQRWVIDPGYAQSVKLVFVCAETRGDEGAEVSAAREKLDELEERAAEQGKMHVELDEVIPGQVDAIKRLQIVALDGMGDWPYQTIETYGSKALSTPCSIDSLQRQLVLARYPPHPTPSTRPTKSQHKRCLY